jgi:penicillin-binding protein 1A
MLNQPVRFSTLEPDEPRSGGGTKGKRVIMLACVVLIALGCGLGAGVRFLYNMSKTLPGPDELQNIRPSLVSKVYASDGTLVHEFGIERRFWVPLDSIPLTLQQAVISIEDRRFYQHWGIDIHRIFGAVLVNLVRREYAQGGSTITQQLARNVYLSLRQTMTRKIREAMTAVELEHYYTKREILELYLNQVYLGAGAYGMEAASRRYFSKHVRQLSLPECATLAGIIQLPEYYRPDKPENLKRITARRNAVINAMRSMSFVKRDEAHEAMHSPVASAPEEGGSGTAPYFMEMVRQHIEETYGEDALYNGGLSIYTTLDPVTQDSSEKAMAAQLKVLQGHTNRMFLAYSGAARKLRMTNDQYCAHFDSLYAAHKSEYADLPDTARLRIVQGAVIVLQTHTGAMRALIGGRNFLESKFNRALQGRRQPGSSFKAFVYTAAIDTGYTPASVVLDQPITLETDQGTWRPENYEREFLGPITLRTALKKSINLVAIRLLMDVGAEKVVSYARRMGLKHDMNAVPALAIGACQATPIEMTVAYSIYPNGGRKVEPYFIEKVLDKNGRLLENHAPDTGAQVISPQTAYIMASLMRSVVTAGTAAAIAGMGFTRPAAGKTGTTNDYSDAWFIGYTPQIVCGVWVGVDERLSMGPGTTGAYAALPIWVPTMKTAHRSLPQVDFNIPDSIEVDRICDESHKLATRACPSASPEYFIRGHLPDTCTVHGGRSISKSSSVLERFGSMGSGASGGAPGKARRKKTMF